MSSTLEQAPASAKGRGRAQARTGTWYVLGAMGQLGSVPGWAWLVSGLVFGGISMDTIATWWT